MERSLEFDWDDGNRRHIARHRVVSVEVEEALEDEFGQLVDAEVIEGEVRFRQVGATAGGRLLMVAFTLREALVRPITAFDASRYMVALYRRGGQDE